MQGDVASALAMWGDIKAACNAAVVRHGGTSTHHHAVGRDHRSGYEVEVPALMRQALAGYLARARGLHCTPEQIVVVQGAQQAIDLCARLLLDADGAFAFEDPGYLMARHCFAATGARALPVPVDEHGLDTRHLPADARVRLAYVTPSHQFPLGGTLPIARRQDLLAWARRQRAWMPLRSTRAWRGWAG